MAILNGVLDGILATIRSQIMRKALLIKLVITALIIQTATIVNHPIKMRIYMDNNNNRCMVVIKDLALALAILVMEITIHT